MPRPPETSLSPAELAELSALADGSLDPARRPAVEAKVNASPVLRDLYERERDVVDLIRGVGTAERAPLRLRTRIAEMQTERPARRRSSVRYATGFAGALVGVAIALALVLPAGSPGSPSVSQAAALATRGPSAPAPVTAPAHPKTQLARDVQGVYFPNWSSTLGARAIGQRSDRLAGRTVVTMYYRWHGKTVAYSILAAPTLPQPRSRAVRLNGFEIRTLNARGRTVVTWRRSGHTCVLSGAGIPARVLWQLAEWRSA